MSQHQEAPIGDCVFTFNARDRSEGFDTLPETAVESGSKKGGKDPALSSIKMRLG
jgi:hypothetical protein